MGTVVFDFDSTLVTCESLDELLARNLDPARAAEVREITDAGMDGRIPFQESLRQRLAIAAPTRAETEAFGRDAIDLRVPGVGELIQALDAEVWIISGGLLDVLYPMAEFLGVPRDRVLGTRITWSDAGELEEAEPRTKIEQLQPLSGDWTQPRIMVGDGMTDYAPFEAGLVDHFVAFTAVVRRAPVVATGAPEAASVRELEYLLAQWL